MKKATLITLIIFLWAVGFAQKTYQEVDYGKIVKAKIGSAKKVLKTKRIFISDFVVRQVTAVSASAQGFGGLTGGSSKASVALALSGVRAGAYQKIVDDLYQEVVTELEDLGFEIMSDQEAVEAFNRLNLGKKIIAKPSEGEPKYLTKKAEALAELRPSNKICIYRDQSRLNSGAEFLSDNADRKIGRKLSKELDAAVMTFEFRIGLAGIKTRNSVVTSISKVKAYPMLMVTMESLIFGPRASEVGWIYTKKSIDGINYWVENLGKKGMVKSVADGTRTGYMGWAKTEMTSPIIAREAEFLKEVKGILSNLDKQIIKSIDEKIN